MDWTKRFCWISSPFTRPHTTRFFLMGIPERQSLRYKICNSRCFYTFEIIKFLLKTTFTIIFNVYTFFGTPNIYKGKIDWYEIPDNRLWRMRWTWIWNRTLTLYLWVNSASDTADNRSFDCHKATIVEHLAEIELVILANGIRSRYPFCASSAFVRRHTDTNIHILSV